MFFYFMKEYITIKELSIRWGISPRRIQYMCSNNQINGAIKFGRDWAIPKDAEKPLDARFTASKSKHNKEMI